MLPPAPVPPNVVVGATIVKRFPGYGERRGTIAEIDLDGGNVIVRWASDERTTLSLGEAAKRALYAVPPTEEDDDDSTIAYDSGDETVDYEGDGGARAASSRFWGVTWDRRKKKWQARYYDADGNRRTVGRFDDGEALALQVGGHHLAHHRLVVDDEHATARAVVAVRGGVHGRHRTGRTRIRGAAGAEFRVCSSPVGAA